jgi:hypothetical protein
VKRIVEIVPASPGWYARWRFTPERTLSSSSMPTPPNLWLRSRREIARPNLRTTDPGRMSAAHPPWGSCRPVAGPDEP